MIIIPCFSSPPTSRGINLYPSSPILREDRGGGWEGE